MDMAMAMAMRFAPYLLAATVGATAFNAAAAAPDSGLYTSYTLSSDATSISASVCGAVPGSSGCYGGGALTGFHRACAVIEGTPTYKGNTATRLVYVLDGQTLNSAVARLWVFRKIDAIAASFDTVTFTEIRRVDTGLPGGKRAACYLAANDTYLFAGTSAATSAARIGKTDYQVTAVGGSIPPANMIGISADERGWVSMNFNGSFYLVGPQSGEGGVGGGQAWIAGTSNGLTFGH